MATPACRASCASVWKTGDRADLAEQLGSAERAAAGERDYRRSLYDGVIAEGQRFDGFVHVDDWVPQRLVTATGPNPLPR